MIVSPISFRSHLLALIPLCLLAWVNAHAQPLFRVASETVTEQECQWAYKRSTRMASNTAPISKREFLDSYSLLRQKAAWATAKGLDTTMAFLKDYDKAVEFLVSQNLFDSTRSDSLCQVVYKRMANTVSLEHIYVPLGEQGDTLSAYLRADSLWRLLRGGTPFQQLGTKLLVQGNMGIGYANLGKVGPLVLPMSIEEVVFTQPDGSFSTPIRYGGAYHIFYTKAHHPNPGRLTFSYVVLPIGANGSLPTPLPELRDSLAKGATLPVLVEQKKQQGDSILSYQTITGVGYGFVPEWLADTLFQLPANAPYALIQRQNSVFLFQRHELITTGTFEEESQYIMRTLASSTQSPLSESAAFDRAAAYAQAAQYPNNMQRLSAYTGDTIAKLYKPLPDEIASMPLLAFGNNSPITVADLSRWITRRHSQLVSQPAANLPTILPEFITQQTYQVACEKLREGDTLFRYAVREYRNGLLLFLMTEQEVWNPELQAEDSLRSIYKANRKSYRFDTCYYLDIYTSENQNALRQAYQQMDSPKGPKKLSKREMRKSGIERQEMRAPSRHPFVLGCTLANPSRKSNTGLCEAPRMTPFSDRPYFVSIRKIRNNVAMDYKEAYPQLVEVYQDRLLQRWEARVRTEMPLTVEQSALEAWLKKP